MKKILIKELHKIIMLITKANDKELDAIAIKLLDIEKEIMKYGGSATKNIVDKL